MEEEKKVYLTIHGHFYQPPRENPWLEAIELQDSALPFHDWNERINQECYNPNSVSKIVDEKNGILDIVNNYSLMSFNFGPTLMSWLEQFAPYTYERIINADIISGHRFSGHGNAIGQVYNHIIMPLANLNDKITQVVWGIKDFQYRFGRKPEGMWLAETAVDDETLKVLVDNGIKFTILSPYQADSIRKIGEEHYQDVSWGNIDPARPYRYFIKSDPDKYIDLFFYDGAISRSVAFDNILKDGNKFTSRLKEGISYHREESKQLINIATDGESYGHHTKFGDMALAYVLRVKAEDEGFTLTNYAEFLEKSQVIYEVEIKQGSSWSCFHGVGRWKEDCGCSTGGQPGWNQKWRKPLREALDYLRDKLIDIYVEEGKKYFLDVWDARNKYIDVILDRTEDNIKKFLDKVLIKNLNDEQQVNALKLLEMQRQAMLMYTSCGWFFSELSGIETVQIMKYAARAMQIAADFHEEDFEFGFLNILSQAKSNIPQNGNGKDIYEKFVKPSVVTLKQIASLWAIKSLYEEFEDQTEIYCYSIKRLAYKKISKGLTNLVFGRLEVKSNITLEKSDIIFALLQYTGGDFHCAIKEFSNTADYHKIQKLLSKSFIEYPITETIRQLDENFGKEYFTLKDIFMEERRKTLGSLLKSQLNKLSSMYQDIYDQSKASIYNLQSLGLPIPNEFKIAAQYNLSREFNSIIQDCGKYIDDDSIQLASDINEESKKIGITLDKKLASDIFSNIIQQKMFKLSNNIEIQRVEGILKLFRFVDILELNLDISEIQSIYFNRIYHKIGHIIKELSQSETVDEDRKLIYLLLELGKKLNIVTEFYKELLIKYDIRTSHN